MQEVLLLFFLLFFLLVVYIVFYLSESYRDKYNVAKLSLEKKCLDTDELGMEKEKSEIDFGYLSRKRRENKVVEC